VSYTQTQARAAKLFGFTELEKRHEESRPGSDHQTYGEWLAERDRHEQRAEAWEAVEAAACDLMDFVQQVPKQRLPCAQVAQAIADKVRELENAIRWMC